MNVCRLLHTERTIWAANLVCTLALTILYTGRIGNTCDDVRPRTDELTDDIRASKDDVSLLLLLGLPGIMSWTLLLVVPRVAHRIVPLLAVSAALGACATFMVLVYRRRTRTSYCACSEDVMVGEVVRFMILVPTLVHACRHRSRVHPYTPTVIRVRAPRLVTETSCAPDPSFE